MSVTVDVTGTAFNSATSPCASSTSITVGASATCLLVFVEIDDATTTITAPTWAGTSMTLIGTGITTDNAGRSSLYGLVSPASGANSLSCSFSGGAPGSMQVCAISFKGSITSSVASCFPNFASVQSSLASYTLNVTSPTGDIAIVAGNANNSSFSGTLSATGSTQIFHVTTTFDAAASRAPGSGTVTWTATLPSSGIATVLTGCDVAAATVASNPFANYNWPLPVQPYRLEETWTQHLMPPQPVGGPFNQYDWPNPRIPQPIEQTWARETVQFWHPFANYDWPNPYPVQWYRSLELNLNQNTLAPAVVQPFLNHDWPVPVYPARLDATWTWSTRIIPQPIGGPFNQYDWPNPRIPQPIDQTWVLNLQDNVLIPVPKPFAQYDWPVPKTPQPIDATWLSDYLYALSTQLPFRQQDWPNPKTPAPIDPTWLQDLVNILSLANPIPHSNYDWPVPRTSQPIDPTWLQQIINLYPPPPPPPPPSQPTTGGRQVWPEELDDLTLASHKWHQRLIEAHAFKTGEEISKIAQALGKRGGEARAKSLTPNQRSNIASKAASIRWR